MSTNHPESAIPGSNDKRRVLVQEIPKPHERDINGSQLLVKLTRYFSDPVQARHLVELGKVVYARDTQGQFVYEEISHSTVGAKEEAK